MKFFFPDSQDQIDPSFDFEREVSSPDRVRQRDDRYAHEVISPPPYSGMLLSKALIDGPGRYTFAQRHRLFRLGVREFFRLDEVTGGRLETMGDCGAFNYVHEEEPPYSVDEVFDFYEECGFDYGISVDHIILAYLADSSVEPREEWQSSPGSDARVRGAVLSPSSSREAATSSRSASRKAGTRRRTRRPCGDFSALAYRYIALGGMVPLKTPQILACLEAIARVRRPRRELHLLGITRTERVNDFTPLRRCQHRQHLAVSAVVQGRPRQLPHPRTQLRRDPGDADRRQPSSQATDPRWRTRSERRATPRTGMSVEPRRL